MQRSSRDRLLAPFPPDVLEWRALAPDGSAPPFLGGSFAGAVEGGPFEDGAAGRDEPALVRMRPQLPVRAVRERLDDALGREGWSVAYRGLPGGAVACELGVQGVIKSAVATPVPGRSRADLLADDAFVRAAELHGLLPAVDTDAEYVVEADPATGEPLYEPDPRPHAGAGAGSGAGASAPSAAPARPAPGGPDAGSAGGGGASTDPAAPLGSGAPDAEADAALAAGARPLSESSGPEPAKPSGQQAIDRLVERLKEAGLGGEVARLVVRYQGYGSDPAAARELYAKLRGLLLERGGGS